MVTATGRDSDDGYYVQATKALAAKLGRENVEFPGHHDVSFWMSEEFANAVLSTLRQYGYSNRILRIKLRRARFSLNCNNYDDFGLYAYISP